MDNKTARKVSAIVGTRGRNPVSGDVPSPDDVVTRLKTSTKGTSELSFPMNGSDASKYPASSMKKATKTQVTPGTWTTKNKI